MQTSSGAIKKKIKFAFFIRKIMNQALRKCGFDSKCKNINVYGSQGFNAVRRKSKNGVMIKAVETVNT